VVAVKKCFLGLLFAVLWLGWVMVELLAYLLLGRQERPAPTESGEEAEAEQDRLTPSRAA
jgi:hypothetical protein